ncbi:MAG: YihY/virulence factor BrkB family protein [Halobacteria archaeon]
MYDTSTDAQLTFLSGALAFYSLLSMFPIMLLAFSFAKMIGQPQIGSIIFTMTGDYLTDALRKQLSHGIRNARSGSSLTIFGFVVLLWSSFRIFRGLDAAFTNIYHTRSIDRSIRERIIDNLVVIISLGLMAVLVGLSDLLLEIESITADGFRFLSLFILIIPVFYVYPTTDISLWDVLPGALLTASVITGLRTLFRVYTLEITTYDATSIVGTFMLFALWFYVASSSVLLGGVLNQSLMRYRRLKKYEQG